MSLKESKRIDYPKIDPMVYKMSVLIALNHKGATLYKSNISFFMRSRNCLVGLFYVQVQVLTL